MEQVSVMKSAGEFIAWRSGVPSIPKSPRTWEISFSIGRDLPTAKLPRLDCPALL
jgi:hypothetical protein